MPIDRPRTPGVSNNQHWSQVYNLDSIVASREQLLLLAENNFLNINWAPTMTRHYFKYCGVTST